MSIVRCEVLNNHNSFQEIQPKVLKVQTVIMLSLSENPWVLVLRHDTVEVFLSNSVSEILFRGNDE